MTETTPGTPFTGESAVEKVRLAEHGWNGWDPAKVALACMPDSRSSNRATVACGRAKIVAFLIRKWAKELDFRPTKELWACASDLITVHYADKYDDSGSWFPAYSNETWGNDENGLMAPGRATINEHPILENKRKFRWPLGRRPDDHPNFSHLGF